MEAKVKEIVRDESSFESKFVVPIRLIAQRMRLSVKLKPSIDEVYHENPVVEMVFQIRRENSSVELLYQ